MNPLRKFLPPLPSARAAARKGSAAVLRSGELSGTALRLLGFNTNLAPVLGYSSPASDVLARSRCFSDDSVEVARYGVDYVQGLERHRILACAGRGNRIERTGRQRRGSGAGRKGWVG